MTAERKTTEVEPQLIVVADDDDDMRSMLDASLRREGFSVHLAHDGFALKTLLKTLSRPPSLIISDIQMPGQGGLDVLAWAQNRFADTPVILITAFGDASLHRRASQLGAFAVIDKPFGLGELLHVIGQALGHKERNEP